MELKEQIEQWLRPVLEEQGLYLVDIRVAGRGKVEVFADGDSGITIQQCADISRYLEGLLDSSGLVSDHYVLDVSSPGMGNPLRVPRQYQKRIGRILEIIRADGTELEAELLAADGERIRVKPIVKEPKKAKKKKDDASPSSLEGVGERSAPNEIELKYAEIKKALIQIQWK